MTGLPSWSGDALLYHDTMERSHVSSDRSIHRIGVRQISPMNKCPSLPSCSSKCSNYMKAMLIVPWHDRVLRDGLSDVSCSQTCGVLEARSKLPT
mmetsp:Transcript_1700/g.3144  ORF Transcript_1700/g.3144 Transcript_1700/m.3144 type:complete len:95 (-) Transcript_1700:374-658(-)